MQKHHYDDLGKKTNMVVDYNEYDKEYTGLFTTKSDLLRIVQLAKLRDITPEQQFNLKEHSQKHNNTPAKTICRFDLNQYKKTMV